MNVVSFVTPSRVQKVSYKTCKRQLSSALQSNGHFGKGRILETLEKGVWYPIIHLTQNPSFHLLREENLLNSDALGDDFVLQQGIYSQIRDISSENLTDSFNLDKSNSSSSGIDEFQSAFILLGYKGLNCCLQDVLEDTWKDWSGARYLYLNIPPRFGLRRIVLYRRVAPVSDVTLFNYILLVECVNVTAKNQDFLLDFVQRFRAQRAQGFLSIYQEAAVDGASSDSTEYRSVTSCSNGSQDNYSGRNDFLSF